MHPIQRTTVALGESTDVAQATQSLTARLRHIDCIVLLAHYWPARQSKLGLMTRSAIAPLVVVDLPITAAQKPPGLQTQTSSIHHNGEISPHRRAISASEHFASCSGALAACAADALDRAYAAVCAICRASLNATVAEI